MTEATPNTPHTPQPRPTEAHRSFPLHDLHVPPAPQFSTQPNSPLLADQGSIYVPTAGITTTRNLSDRNWDEIPRLGMKPLKERYEQMSYLRRGYLRVVIWLGLRRSSPIPQYCARIGVDGRPDTATPEEDLESGLTERKKWESRKFVVVGFMNMSSGVPSETVVVYGDEKGTGYPDSIRQGIKRLRGRRYFLSPRVVTKLELYECLPTTGSHRLIALDERKQKQMTQLFREYQLDRDPYIADWIHNNITKHNFAISLRLGWSPMRITFLVLSPLVFSLAIGIWYMIRYDDVQTAWTISSYIVTASGVLIALISVVAFMK